MPPLFVSPAFIRYPSVSSSTHSTFDHYRLVVTRNGWLFSSRRPLHIAPGFVDPVLGATRFLRAVDECTHDATAERPEESDEKGFGHGEPLRESSSTDVDVGELAGNAGGDMEAADRHLDFARWQLLQPSGVASCEALGRR